jgi:general stress protein 26
MNNEAKTITEETADYILSHNDVAFFITYPNGSKDAFATVEARAAVVEDVIADAAAWKVA